MDLLVEIVMDLIAEGLSETSKSAKVPRPIRYIAIGLIVLFSCAVIGLVFLVGYMLLQETPLGGTAFLLLGMFLAVMGVYKFRKTYLEKVCQAEESAGENEP